MLSFQKLTNFKICHQLNMSWRFPLFIKNKEVWLYHFRGLDLTMLRGVSSQRIKCWTSWLKETRPVKLLWRDLANIPIDRRLLRDRALKEIKQPPLWDEKTHNRTWSICTYGSDHPHLWNEAAAMRPWNRVKSLHATTLKTTAGQRANQTEILKSLFQATMKREETESSSPIPHYRTMSHSDQRRN